VGAIRFSLLKLILLLNIDMIIRNRAVVELGLFSESFFKQEEHNVVLYSYTGMLFRQKILNLFHSCLK